MPTRKDSPIDDYLAALKLPAARKTLTTLRAQLRKLLPEATETLSYGMPAFRLDNGKVAAGFGFFGQNCGLYPHSGNVIANLGPALDGYKTSKGGVTFAPGDPLPLAVVKAVVEARLAEIAGPGARKRVPRKTASSGFQVGVQKAMPLSASEAWALIAGHPERWLGKGAELALEPGQPWRLPKRRGAPAVQGVVRVVKPGQRVRMTWHAEGWKKPATLQLTLMPKARSTALHVHMEKLPDAKAREALREHWQRVLAALKPDAAR